MLETLEKKFLDAFKKVKNEEQSVKADLQAALKRREDLHTLALPREDVIDMFCGWVDDLARHFPQKMQKRHENILHGPLRNWNIVNFNPLALWNNDKIEPMAMAFVFNSALKEGIAGAIKKWDWPEDVGPPLADRKKEIAELDKTIAELQERLDKIRALAEGQTVNLSGISAGDAADKPIVKQAKKIANALKGGG